MMVEAIDHLELEDRFDVVEAFVRSWSNHDIESCLEHVAPNVQYSDNIGDSYESYKGAWHGKDELRRIMLMVKKHWTHLAMMPRHFRPRMEDPALIQCQIEFVLLHKASGEFLFGNNRLVTRFEDGLISEIQVFHDAPMFRAFLRLIATKACAGERAASLPANSTAVC